MSEITITYETVFDLLRREKNREDLQELNPRFFADVVGYLTEKESLLRTTDDDIFSATERKKTERQLENVKRILIELYGRREKKIVNLAIEKSITNSDLIDTTHLLNEEHTLFNELVTVISASRKDILYALLESKIPGLVNTSNDAVPEKKEDEPKTETPPAEPSFSEQDNTSNEEQSSALVAPNLEEESPLKKDPPVKVKFLEHVPPFIGKELEEYGPFDQGDEAELPEELARVLLHNTQAEKL